MFFKKESVNKETNIEIHIYDYSTSICLIKNEGILDTLELDYGIKTVIETSYNESCFIDNSLKDLSLDDFIDLHYNKIYTHIKNYVSNINYSILMKLKIPNKINRIYVFTRYNDLLKREFYNQFNNCYIKKVA